MEDANEFKVEIRVEGQSVGVLILATSTEDGVYIIEHTFIEEGIYEIQSYVTAYRMHV
ncbi:hypothetical protein JCM19039_2228 [Geomicrobium sp. JCM 19039]|nr:hypothetical protein JCM19039_2228 [Geomicrobium sp. JCM 19039]